MPLLLHEIKERLKALDEVTLLELLEISSEDLIEMFSERIEDNADKLEREVKWINTQWHPTTLSSLRADTVGILTIKVVVNTGMKL